MRYVFTFLLTLAMYSATAQCCPYLQLVQVLPANPTPADHVRLVFQATTPGRGNLVSTDFVHAGNNLTFTACYYSGPLAALQDFSDTVRVGQLPAGSYTVTFIAQLSGNSQQCVEQQRNSNSRTFQVSGTLATRPPIDGWALYPVPATGRLLSLTAPATQSIRFLQLLDVTGQECLTMPTTWLSRPEDQLKLELPPLPAGTYTLRIHLASEKVIIRRLVLQ
jgi:hypothetical protein